MSEIDASSVRAGAVVAALIAVTGCSRPSDDQWSPAAPAVSTQARAIQSAIARAQSACERQAAAASMDAAAVVPTAPTVAPQAALEPPTVENQGQAGLLGRAPAALTAAPGAPHIYHVAAEDFFLDRADDLGLTSEQRARLTAIRDKAELDLATTQRGVDQGEQDLWALTASDAPDARKIGAKVDEISRLEARKRMDYLHALGSAVAVLTDAQRKAAVSPMPMAANDAGTNDGMGIEEISDAAPGRDMGGM